jgi:ELP3 family radical SAM enzyme/protein acetyltransferase
MELLGKRNTVIIGDQWKCYPTMVLPDTKILTWFENGKKNGAVKSDFSGEQKMYVPYGSVSPFLIDELLSYTMTHCPSYIRINRVVRDFAKREVSGGTDRLDLRNIISSSVKSDGLRESDIRSREVKGKFIDIDDTKVFIDQYRASSGTEYFISLENTDKTILYGFVRLRFNDCSPSSHTKFDVLKDKAFIRELHVYGAVIPKGESAESTKTQHLGIGKFLVYLAETIAKKNGWNDMAIIAGNGTRSYYEKLGYSLEETFMVKNLNDTIPCPPMWISRSPFSSPKQCNLFALFHRNRAVFLTLCLMCIDFLFVFYLSISLFLR